MDKSLKMICTWFAGADGVVVGGPAVGVIAAEPGAHRHAPPVVPVAVLVLPAVRVHSTFCTKHEVRVTEYICVWKVRSSHGICQNLCKNYPLLLVPHFVLYDVCGTLYIIVQI